MTATSLDNKKSCSEMPLGLRCDSGNRFTLYGLVAEGGGDIGVGDDRQTVHLTDDLLRRNSIQDTGGVHWLVRGRQEQRPLLAI